jgi:hypothetical protein
VKFGAGEYRAGAFERLADSRILLEAANFGGSVYLAGRAVEAMLRAVIWKRDADIRAGRKALETGHDLRELLTLVRNLGLLKPGGHDDEFVERVQRVARMWFNDMRFASGRSVESLWRGGRIVTRRDTLKRAAGRFFEDCSAIIKRCELLCEQ